MPSSKKRTVRKVLADGTVKTYEYNRTPAPRQPRVAPNSVDALLNAYRRSQEWEGLAPASRKLYAIYHRDIARFGALAITDVSRRFVLEVRDAIAVRSGLGAANAFARTFSALFGWAVERGWIEHSPASRIKALKGGSLPAWTPEEADQAVQVLPAQLGRAVLLARYTGQRRGDLAQMTWAAWDGSSIRLTQGKTGTSLVIPAHRRLRAALAEWKGDPDRGLYILRQDTNRPWTADYLGQRMREALAEHGFREGINLHGLRKLAATELAEAGCSALEIQAITGHASLAMVSLYTRSADQERLAKSAIYRLQKPRR